MQLTDRRWIVLAAILVIAGVTLMTGVLPAAAQQGNATTTPTATRTATRVVRRTATPTRTPTPARALPPPLAQVILPAPSVKNQLVGDVVSQVGVPLSADYPTRFGDRIALGMANLRDVTVGEEPGAGIASVEFTVFDLRGEVMFRSQTGLSDRFCAFGGAGEECATFDFDSNGYRWPGGEPVVSGRYTLVAFARGVEESHKGAWTLNFEVRLSRDGKQGSDGEARILSVARSGPTAFDVTVETMGFVPFARSTHLIFYSSALKDVEARPGAPGVFLVYPAHEEMDLPGAYGSATVTVPVPGGQYRRPTAICVAVAQPDNTVIPGRGDCVRLPR